jgi:CBS domain-containing protein
VKDKWFVRDVMSTPAHTIGSDAGFKEIARQLDALKVSALPVVERDGQLIGIVSEADLLLKEEHGGEKAGSGPLQLPRHRRENLKAAGQRARELMSAPVVTTTANTPLSDAARTMRERRVKRLVVVDADGCVEGIISRVDILRVFLRPDDVIHGEVVSVARDVLWLEDADVRVRVKEGVVTMDGRVPRMCEAEILRELVQRLGGVVAVGGEISYVDDDTRVPSDPREFWFFPEMSVRALGPAPERPGARRTEAQ